MAEDLIRYDVLVQDALRGIVRKVLSEVARTGLPGDHHFYICFETDHPGVDIPDWLHDKYPEEMTIVLQEWFADLAVTNDGFSVTLNFSEQAQKLVIPFEAVRTFVDPSVKFGLKFDAHDPDEPDDPEALDEDEILEDDEAAGTDDGADVVSLDKFRKH